MKKVFVGFFEVPGHGTDSIEVPFTGSAGLDYHALGVAIQKRHPKVKGISRLSARVEDRDPENAFVDITPGAVLSNLFAESDSRIIGGVFFNGEPADIQLRYFPAASIVTLHLRSKLPTGGVISFGNKISSQRLATELPELVKTTLGADAREIKLNLRFSK